MLTISESKIIFFYITVFCAFAIIPFQINRNTGKLRACSKFHRKLWCFFFSLSALYSFHGTIQFVIWFGNDIHSAPLQTSVIQLGFSYASTAYLTVTFLAEGRQPGLVVQIFNELYTPSEFQRHYSFKFEERSA